LKKLTTNKIKASPHCDILWWLAWCYAWFCAWTWGWKKKKWRKELGIVSRKTTM